MPEESRSLSFASRLVGFRPALIALTAAIAIHALCWATVGISGAGIFFIYLLSILIAAWCGYTPGGVVLFTALCVLPWFYRPNFSLRKLDPAGVIVLVALWLIISRVSEGRRRNESELRRVNEQLDHRVREQTSAIRHQLAELEALYAQIPSGVCFLDSELRFARVNETFAAISGAAPSEHIGREVREMLPAPLATILEPVFRQALDTGQPVAGLEVDAGPDWMVSCAQVRSVDGSVLGLQVTIQDITERKRAESALIASNDQLLNLNAELEQFAFVASHDLQEPLRTVNIYSELLLRHIGKDDAEAVELARHVSSGVLRMHSLIRDLVQYSRTLHEPDDQTRPAADLNICLEEATNVLEGKIRATGAEVVAPHLPIVVGDRALITQVFQNLLSNALKYRNRSTNPAIHVSAEQSGGSWIISVRDNGIGFDSRYSDQIFGLFKRLHHNSEIPGTGLGLAISRRIVERYGGRIWAESEVGVGSTFHFSLPIAVPTRAEAQSV